MSNLPVSLPATGRALSTAPDEALPSTAAEPPRKRQRTTERELAPTPPCGALPPPNPSVPRSSSAGALSAGSPTTRASAGTGSDNGESDSVWAVGADGQGGAAGPSDSMKGRLKGKAKEGTFAQEETTPAWDDRRMVWQSAPEGQYPACGTELGRCEPEHAASGAISMANSESTLGLARPQIVDAHPTVDLLRDKEYYIDSADCVIRVEDTLFRVHRYFLGRDSSAFEHMFGMPSQGLPPQSLEGGTDTNPIRLYGESVERFRALLSVIYDLPLQLQAYNTPAADVERLLTIAEMTNKYHFASIEKWAVDALYNVISGLHGPPQQQYALGHCSSAWMKRLLEVALLCGHHPLRNLVADKWVDRIVARDLRPVHALELADRSGLRRLQGYAYYVQLLEMGDGFDPGVVEDGKQFARVRMGPRANMTAVAAAGPGEDGQGKSSQGPRGTPAVLTRGQRQRLLSGHWLLTRLWDGLRTSPPKFERPEGCTYHQHGCLVTWTAVWQDVGKSEKTLRFPCVDVLGRLRAMEEQLFMHTDLSCSLTPQCKRGALLALKATVKEVQEGLADQFADLTDPAAAVGKHGEVEA